MRSLSRETFVDQRHFTLLDTSVTLRAEEGALRFVDAFIAQYDGKPSGAESSSSLLVTVTRGEIEGSDGSRPVVVHSASIDYWNITGDVVSDGPARCVVWASKRMQVRLHDECSIAEVTIDPGVSPRVAGELAFHVCRGIALYKRDSKSNLLLHAAAVVSGEDATLFCGPKRAGKTTLFVESVKQGAAPLSNDRVYLRTRLHLRAESWPGYFSVCEGTLLSHPPLIEEVRRYDEPTYDLRTVDWPADLVWDFQARKRLYPKEWLVRAFGRRYRWSARVRQIVFAKVIEDHAGEPVFTDVDAGHEKGRAALEQRIRSVAFCDEHDSGFPPWHGLGVDQARTGAVVREVANACRSHRVDAVEVRCHPRQVPEVVQRLGRRG